MRSGQILVTISAGTQDQQVAIPLIDDDINEASEGFFVVVVEDDIAIPETSVELVRDGVTLVRIEDDDCKSYDLLTSMDAHEAVDLFCSNSNQL